MAATTGCGFGVRLAPVPGPGAVKNFLYIAGANTIAPYLISTATGSFAASGTAFTAPGTPNFGAMAMHPSNSAMVVSATGASSVIQLNVDKTTGGLSLVGQPPTPTGPGSMSFSSDGSLLFVSCNSGASIAAFAYANGSIGQSSVNTAVTNPGLVFVDPTNHFLFVGNSTGGTIGSYSIGANRALSAGPNATLPVNGLLAFPPGAPGIYSVAGSSFSINSISATPGTLGNSLQLATLPSSNPSSLVFSPDGTMAFVGDTTANAIHVYRVNPGLFTATLLKTNAITLPSLFVVDPTGKFLYQNVTNGGASSVVIYSINSATGALSTSSTIAYAGQIWGLMTAAIPQ
ncbi:MAG: lactonase family protein [Bdellovibrionota bacterium]